MSDYHYRYDTYLENAHSDLKTISFLPSIFENRNDEYYQKMLGIYLKPPKACDFCIGIDVLPPHYVIQFRSNHVFMGCYVLRGAVSVNSSLVRAGSFFYTDPDRSNEIVVSGGEKYIGYWFTYRGADAITYYHYLQQQGCSPMVSVPYVEDISTIFQLYLTQVRPIMSNKLFIDGVINTLFSCLPVFNGGAPIFSGSGKSISYLRKAIEYVEANYNDPDITVDQVAKKIYISRKHLNRIFRESMHSTLQQYLIECRMKSAALYLKKTDYPTKKIATMVGYRNLNSFYLAFKKFYDCTPTEFKQWKGR